MTIILSLLSSRCDPPCLAYQVTKSQNTATFVPEPSQLGLCSTPEPLHFPLLESLANYPAPHFHLLLKLVATLTFETGIRANVKTFCLSKKGKVESQSPHVCTALATPRLHPPQPCFGSPCLKVTLPSLPILEVKMSVMSWSYWVFTMHSSGAWYTQVELPLEIIAPICTMKSLKKCPGWNIRLMNQNKYFPRKWLPPSRCFWKIENMRQKI